MKRLSLVILVIPTLLAVFVGAAVNTPRQWLGGQVNLLAPLIVYAALEADVTTVALVAVLGGLAMDSLSANPLGASVLPLFWIGLALMWRRDVLLRELSYAQFVLGTVAGVLAPAMTCLLLFTVGERPLVGWSSLFQWILLAPGSGVLTPPCFWLLTWLSRRLTYQPIITPAFRSDHEMKRGRN